MQEIVIKISIYWKGFNKKKSTSIDPDNRNFRIMNSGETPDLPIMKTQSTICKLSLRDKALPFIISLVKSVK